jgi:hypothetical protein
MPISVLRPARRAKAHSLLLATLLASGWQSPALARDPQAIAGQEQRVQQVEIKVANVDLGVAGEQIRRHHRFDDTLFSVCDDVGNVSDLPQRQREDCVQLKRDREESRESCARNAQSCRADSSRHTRQIARPRPNYGPRSFP